MPMDEVRRPWQPIPPHQVATWFRAFPGRWWIAGGWALDLYLRHPTRLHDDTDILILRQDVQHIHHAFPGWTIMAADPPGTLRRWHGDEQLPDHVHDIWCRRATSDSWEFQFMVMDSSDDRWLFRRDHRISGQLADLNDVLDGIPILAPEVQLLYKATSRQMREKDTADLHRMVPHLTDKRRRWLRDAIAIIDPGNPVLKIPGTRP